MKTINLSKFGPVISDEKTGNSIYNIIIYALKNNDTVIAIDMQDIKSMATFCAKQIFGVLYVELGSSEFYKKIKLENVSDDLKTIIKIGIVNAINEFKSNQ